MLHVQQRRWGKRQRPLYQHPELADEQTEHKQRMQDDLQN